MCLGVATRILKVWLCVQKWYIVWHNTLTLAVPQKLAKVLDIKWQRDLKGHAEPYDAETSKIVEEAYAAGSKRYLPALRSGPDSPLGDCQPDLAALT